jgi:hypothetical protein
VLAMQREQVVKTAKKSGLHKGIQVAAALSYYWVICQADRAILSPMFAYQGLIYRSASTWTQVIIVTLILFCTAATPVRMRQPSDSVLYVLLPLVVIPVLTVSATDPLFMDVESGVIASVIGAYLLLALCSKIPRPLTKMAPKAPRRGLWGLVIVVSAASYISILTTFGFHLRLLSFSDVYGVRSVFSEQASGLTGYLVDWQANVINPILIVYGIRANKILLPMAGILGDFFIYSTTGFKSILFSVLAVTAFVFLAQWKNSAVKTPAIGARIGVAFTVLVAASYLIDAFSGSIAWTSLFIRRLSLVAGVNTGYYYQYFSTAPKTHLDYGAVGAILGDARVASPTSQIALYAYHSTVGAPNANIWADAFANFGYPGVVSFTLVLAAFLWLYDRLAQHVDRKDAAALLIASALSLANSALFTCLLTHGMLLALVAITQWPRRVPKPAVAGKQFTAFSTFTQSPSSTATQSASI